MDDIKYEKKAPAKLMYISKNQLQEIMSHPKQDPLRNLYPHHIGTTAEGRKYIRTYRKKTSVESFIPLHPVAEQIISLYNTTDDSKPIFPLPIRDMIWFEIHELGFSHQFKHNLSYHQSRHTFGTLMVSAGVPMESISKMMGHTNIRTTQGYAKVTDDKISEDMDRLMEKRNLINEIKTYT